MKITKKARRVVTQLEFNQKFNPTAKAAGERKTAGVMGGAKPKYRDARRAKHVNREFWTREAYA